MQTLHSNIKAFKHTWPDIVIPSGQAFDLTDYSVVYHTSSMFFAFAHNFWRITPVLLLPFTFLLISVVACKPADLTQVGTANKPLVLKILPGQGIGASDKLAQLTQKQLERYGIAAHVSTTTDVPSLVQEIGAGKTHGALFNTLGYVVARKWTHARPHLRLIFRSGKSVYRGKIIARTDSGINQPSDLTGRRIAFKDRYSTTGFLLPRYYFRQNKILPAQTEFLASYKNVVQGVYDKSFDAGAIYYDDPDASGKARDARSELIDTPDATTALKIIADTGELPSGPLALDDRLTPTLKESIQRALLAAITEDPEFKDTLMDALGAIGFIKASDEDYAQLPSLISGAGLEEEDLIEKGYTLKIREALQRIE
ncbi:MAG: phosphate/phosphite/phosphonate ABC transporter substrate-binding protein [Spirochaetia bacterium]|nr:phosphate/phosphite/phosphonate ABC transporter substrate-binding protein [Spirochaetia bacterium]